MTIALGILQLLACMSILVGEYNRRSISLFFWGMLCVVFAIPHAVDSLVGGYACSRETMATASAFVLLFCATYLAARIILYGDCKSCRFSGRALDVVGSAGSFWREVDARESIVVAAAVVFAAGVIVFSYVNLGGVANATWGSLYAAQSGLSTPLFALAPYIFASAGGAFVVLLSERRWLPLFILSLACMAYLMITRNRVIMLSIVCPICILIASRIKRVTLKDAIMGSVLVFVIVYCVYAILVFRHAGTIGSFVSHYSFGSFNQEVFSSILSGEGELGLRNIFYHFIENDNDFEGFSQGATYLRLLLFWLPSEISQGLKPDDFAITMASGYYGMPYNDTYSVHPTFFGDAYASFGFSGFMTGVFWGLFVSVLDKWLSSRRGYKEKIYLSSAWAYAFVIVGRGSVYNGMMIGIIATILILCVSKLLSMACKQQRDGCKTDKDVCCAIQQHEMR